MSNSRFQGSRFEISDISTPGAVEQRSDLPSDLNRDLERLDVKSSLGTHSVFTPESSPTTVSPLIVRDLEDKELFSVTYKGD